MIEHRFRDYIVRFYDRHSGISLDVILSARALPGFISSRGGGDIIGNRPLPFVVPPFFQDYIPDLFVRARFSRFKIEEMKPLFFSSSLFFPFSGKFSFLRHVASHCISFPNPLFVSEEEQ